MIPSLNSNSAPMNPNFGGLLDYPALNPGYYQTTAVKGTVLPLGIISQVAGLIPLFPCTSKDCRYGKDKTDVIADTSEFVLPVFAQNAPTSVDPYYNDYNTFLFEFKPNYKIGCSLKFYLDKKVGSSWVQQSELNNSTYGTYYAVNTLCTSLPQKMWCGFEIQWYKVLTALGEGTYRFRAVQSLFGLSIFSTCVATAPFCLQTWSCYNSDRTTKFETIMSGGKLGNVDKTLCGGKFWEFCCLSGNPPQVISSPITWRDSIRVSGIFGFENSDYERKNIKYQTGVINKIRDELIAKFTWISSPLPFWFHERFKMYGLVADKLMVSDYNIYQSDYNLKRYCIVADSGYSPEYHHGGGALGGSQYSRVKVEFKSGIQYLIRTRCCDSPIISAAGNAP